MINEMQGTYAHTMTAPLVERAMRALHARQHCLGCGYSMKVLTQTSTVPQVECVVRALHARSTALAMCS